MSSQQDSCIGFSVTPVTAVDTTELKANIQTNKDLIKNWIDGPYPINDGRAFICSGGPSLKDDIEDIKKEYVVGKDIIVCVKHSLGLLVASGITPDYCVTLDPRPVDGESSHGWVRKDLYELAVETPDTVFLVGSMVHPSTTEYLLSLNAKVVGFHAMVAGVEGVLDLTKDVGVTGGTSSGMRAISLAHLMGYRKYRLYGFDSCVNGLSPDKRTELDEKGRFKYFDIPVRVKNIEITKGDLEEQNEVGKHLARIMGEQAAILAANGYHQESRFFKSFTVTGELVAQLQDIENWVKIAYYDTDMWMKPSRTAGYTVFETTTKDLRPYQKGSFTDWYKQPDKD